MRFILVLLLGISLGLLQSAADKSAAPQVVWTYDAQSLHALDLRNPSNARQIWDSMHVLSALQGLVNLESPCLLKERHSEVEVEVVDPYTFFGLIRLHLTSAP